MVTVCRRTGGIKEGARPRNAQCGSKALNLYTRTTFILFKARGGYATSAKELTSGTVSGTRKLTSQFSHYWFVVNLKNYGGDAVSY